MVVAYQNCGGFQSSNDNINVASNLDEELARIERINIGKALYSTHCASCHAPIDSSSKLGRTTDQILGAIESIAQMNNLAHLSQEDLDAISEALIFEANGGDLEQGENGRLQFSCTPGIVSKTPLLKLTNREFRASLNQLLDGFSTNLKTDAQLVSLYNNLPLDSIVVDRNTLKEQSQLVTQLSTNGFFDTAYRAGQLVAQNATGLSSYPGTNGCLSQGTITQACHRNFVRQLSSVAFRKPISANEATAISNQFWDSSLTKENLLIMTFTGIAQSPDFIYKALFNGTTDPTRENLVSLNNHELATKLSYFITGGPPDSTLRNLADSGQLSSNDVISAQVDRLLQTPGAQDMIRRLFRESLGYDIYDSFNYANSYLDGISTNGLQQAMTGELDSFFTELVLNQRAPFSSLFTSRYSNINNASLRQIYGVSGTGVITLPEERMGFLNRAAMLTKRSGYRASPIKRGLHVLEHVLCVNVGEPPPSAPTSLPDLGSGALTTRQSTEGSSEAPGSSCVQCHGRFNSFGYAFENFDTLGRLRSSERVFDGMGNLTATLPINTRASSTEIGANTVSFDHSMDLSQELGQSDRAMMCFTKHLKKFEARKNPTSADNCQMNQSLQSLYGNSENQGTLTEAIKQMVLSEEFRYWSY